MIARVQRRRTALVCGLLVRLFGLASGKRRSKLRRRRRRRCRVIDVVGDAVVGCGALRTTLDLADGLHNFIPSYRNMYICIYIFECTTYIITACDGFRPYYIRFILYICGFI